MCESAVYLVDKDDNRQLLMDEAVLVKRDGDNIVLMNIIGEKQTIPASIEHIDLLKHQVLLRRRN